MHEFDFTLTFDIRDLDLDSDSCADHLYGNGCDDALIGIGQPGFIALNFIREANTAEEAVTSALEDVRQTLPKAPLIEAAPDLGGISDIAELMDSSRQYIRRLITSDNTCPPPLHNGKSALWHMHEVLVHLNNTHRCQGLKPEVISLTEANQRINMIKEYRKLQYLKGCAPDKSEQATHLEQLINV